MQELKITKERVTELWKNHPESEDAIKCLFPEFFKELTAPKYIDTGSVFTIDNANYIFAQVEGSTFNFINLVSGNRFTYPFRLHRDVNNKLLKKDVLKILEELLEENGIREFKLIKERN